MRGRILFITVLIAAVPLSDASYAQLSPQGVIGGITRPFRQVLGHARHYPRARHHRGAAAEARAAVSMPREISNSAGARLGWVGPPAWPSAYEDTLSFTFWPDDYAARLRGHGFDLIADSVTGRFDLPRTMARTATTGSAVRNDAGDESSVDRCGDTSSTDNNWPTSRLEQVLQLSDAQRAELEKVQAAAAQSAKNIQADCRAPAGLAPPDRLRALVQTLWAVRDAGVSMREPLRGFMDTLTNPQKNTFVSAQPRKMPRPEAKPSNDEIGKQYQACASQNAERAERLIKEIEIRVRPDKDQAQSFENLHKVSSDMAKMLIASCARPIPADPLARLDSANDQLTAINYAAMTVQIAFDDFYSRLKNNQRARFDTLAR